MLPVLIVVVVVIVIVVAVLARRGAGQASSRVEARLAELDVEHQAKGTFHGLASGGDGQVRRLGQLVLTPDALVFIQFVPEGEVTIRRADLTAVNTSKEFLDKTHASELLVVSFSGDGIEGGDQAAWELPDVEAWRTALAG